MKTLLILPINDAESVMIHQIAQKLPLEIVTTKQPHGATIDKIEGIVETVKTGEFEKVVIIELPGKVEKEIEGLESVKEMKIIDHHQYGELDRAYDEKGNVLPSSLEQFLEYFGISDDQLVEWGFDPRRVKNIGIMDRDYAWGMLKEGRDWDEIQDAFSYRDELSGAFRNMSEEASYLEKAKEVWEKKEEWNGYFIVSSDSDMTLRRRISRIIALERKERTPLIVLEPARGLIYVQETSKAKELKEAFGGFTYGDQNNWGFKNSESEKVTLDEVKKVLQ